MQEKRSFGVVEVTRGGNKPCAMRWIIHHVSTLSRGPLVGGPGRNPSLKLPPHIYFVPAALWELILVARSCPTRVTRHNSLVDSWLAASEDYKR